MLLVGTVLTACTDSMARGARGSSSCLLDAYVCFDSRLRDINFLIYVNNNIFILSEIRPAILCVLGRLALAASPGATGLQPARSTIQALINRIFV